MCLQVCIQHTCRHGSEWEGDHEDWKAGHHVTLMNCRSNAILKDREKIMERPTNMKSLQIHQKLERPTE